MTNEEAIEILQEEHNYVQEPCYVMNAIKKAIEALQAAEKCDHNATEMRPSFISDHSGGANKMVDLCGKDNNVSTNIDLEAWEPCGETCRNNCETCEHNADELFGDADYCKDCHCYSKWESSYHKYCERCGRPRTPEARAMLEKRLRG